MTDFYWRFSALLARLLGWGSSSTDVPQPSDVSDESKIADMTPADMLLMHGNHTSSSTTPDFSADAKAAARAIVSVFETGKPVGDPAALAVLPDGAGISYGMHQATHRSGTLAKVVAAYCRGFADIKIKELDAYVRDLRDTSRASVDRLARDSNLKYLLREAGKDPKMRTAQFEVFDREYMQRAIDACLGSGFTHALSLAVVYDSMIHGAYGIIRDRVSSEARPTEKEWIRAYIDQRLLWLHRHSKRILRRTIYRPKVFQRLVEQDNWGLTPPFEVRGRLITQEVIDANQ